MGKKCVTMGHCLLDTSYCPTCEYFQESWPQGFDQGFGVVNGGLPSWQNPTSGDVLITEYKDGKPMWYMPDPWQNTREVCRWDVEATLESCKGEFDVLSKDDWRVAAAVLEQGMRDMRSAFDSLIVCYEELAGEVRERKPQLGWGEYCPQDADNKVAMPYPTEDQVSVRPYVRAKPRRSRVSPNAETGQRSENLGDGGDPEGEGPRAQPSEATEAMGMVCHPVSVGPQPEAVLTTTATEGVVPVYIIPQSGEERSE